MKKIIRKAAAVLTLSAIIASFSGCAKNDEHGANNKTENNVVTNPETKSTEDPPAVMQPDVREGEAMVVNLMEGISAEHEENTEEVSLQEYGLKLNNFALNLFNSCRTGVEKGENTLVSPLSVVLALAMTANGADGETLSQMEKTLGVSKDELNEFAYLYAKLLSKQNPSYGKLELANSIWFTADEGFKVEQPFLLTNAKYYNADIFKAPFDNSTLNAINNWVNEKTNGMIPSILDYIPDDAVMYLVNALAFDAEWTKKYNELNVIDGTFTTADGKEETKTFLHGVENSYLEDENASGFIKYYKGHQYAFVALLPNEGVDIDSYLEKLDGTHLSELLENKKDCAVYTSIPKFKVEYSVEMSEQLSNLGMALAFDKGKADFKKIGASAVGNISIDRVLHKTFIAVDENGTKAGAATIVEMELGGLLDREELKEVYLTRPFVYMLVDCRTNSPFFIGIMRDLDK